MKDENIIGYYSMLTTYTVLPRESIGIEGAFTLRVIEKVTGVA